MRSATVASEPAARRVNDEALALVHLRELMAASAGDRRVAVGLLDGPVGVDHPDLESANVHAVESRHGAVCVRQASGACAHGTFVAGILSAERGSRAPAICPECPPLGRPPFDEAPRNGRLPPATPDEVADAIVACVAAGARVLNLSVATDEPSTRVEHRLRQALDRAASRGVLVVAAAGNRPTLGASPITRHPWVIPVAGYGRRGRLLQDSTLGGSIGRRGLGAPAEGIESLAPGSSVRVGGGTSAATAFVTGAVALLWSLFPRLRAHELRNAVLHGERRRAVTPPLLDGGNALRVLRARR